MERETTSPVEMTEPWRVLLVDDDDDFQRLVSCILEDDSRFTVVATAASAGSAMAAVEVHNPDLLVLDHGLPDALGAPSVHSLKSMADDMRVVICSASPKCADATELKVDAWIEKSNVWALPDLLLSVVAMRPTSKSA